MTTFVHLLAIAFATAIAAALIYRLIRKYEPRLAKGVVIIFAVFGGLLTSVASIKTNSPPARAIAHAIAICTNAFNALEQQTGYSFTEAHTNEIHNLAMPDNAQLAERIARRGAHQDGFWLFDAWTNRLAREGLNLENPVWIQTDGTITVRSPSPGIPIEELSLYTTYSNITVYAPLQGSYGFLPGSRWPEFNVSRIWMAVTDRDSRVITWEGALRDRDPAQPVSFQAEFKRNGDIEYHYNPAQTNFTGIGLYRGGAAQTFGLADLPVFQDLAGPTTNHFTLTTLLLSYIGDLGDGTGDTDDDELTDWEEIKVHHTDPHLADTDCDGVGDGYEVQNGTAPLNPDSDGDGIPDGATPEAWSNNVLRATAETANFSVTLLDAVPQGGRAALRVGDLTVLLSAAGTYWFNLPTNAVNTFSFASQGCDGLLLDAAVVSAPPTRGASPDALYHIEDADGILGTGRRVDSGEFHVYWPWLRLVPRDGTECLHNGETWKIFDVDAGPMSWANVARGSVSLDNLVPEDGGYKLSLDGEDYATGTLTLGGPWLSGGSCSATVEIHKCVGWSGRYCHLCGLSESLPCSHVDFCAAVTNEEGECTCPAFFIPVNIDDDDGDGTFDLRISSPGTNACGVIALSMEDADGGTYGFEQITFQTVADIFTRDMFVALAGGTNRLDVSINPMLTDYPATIDVSPPVTDGALLFGDGGVAGTTLHNVQSVQALPGWVKRGYQIHADLGVQGVYGVAQLNVIGLRCEPITTDTDLLGNLYNPVCCVLGRPSKFRIVIEPSGLIPDDDIVWHVSGPGAVTLSPARSTEVSVTPSVAGEYTLEVQIAGYDGPPPFIKFKGVTETVTSVRAWILGDDDHYSRTEAEVRAMFEGVNEIYRQAGMRFVVESVTFTNMPNYLDLEENAAYTTKLRTICDVASNTGGLEFYFIDRLKEGRSIACNVPGYNGSTIGIVASTNATAIALGHEIGHTCGLQDIYISDPATTNSVTGNVSHGRLPDDWGTNSDVGYYPPALTQAVLLQRLLMYGKEVPSMYDLSYGDVYGLYYIPTISGRVWFLNTATVGFARHANRTPTHQ